MLSVAGMAAESMVRISPLAFGAYKPAAMETAFYGNPFWMAAAKHWQIKYYSNIISFIFFAVILYVPKMVVP